MGDNRIRVSALGVMLLVGMAVAGCQSLTRTKADRQHHLTTIRQRDARAIVEDIDMVTLRDHPTRLTRWHD